ncbi:Hypothetical predicted protein [Lynx pardinus]|uniref:Uncharacterized protein n=1 Tax=Lynx pardinus TaxID=191816 RepID=A0A485NDC6_LYNPA|nr:Hypothetical predicted protein [Lynx pardinus]
MVFIYASQWTTPLNPYSCPHDSESLLLVNRGQPLGIFPLWILLYEDFHCSLGTNFLWSGNCASAPICPCFAGRLLNALGMRNKKLRDRAGEGSKLSIQCRHSGEHRGLERQEEPRSFQLNLSSLLSPPLSTR